MQQTFTKVKSYNYKNITVSFSEAGKGSTLLFLHGFLENHSLWNNVAAHFSQKYRVITVDLLGHGATGCTGYVHTMEDHADMLFGLISHLRLRKINVVGHSMGGYIGLAFAELYPDHVKSLTLINSTSRADSEERKINRDRAMDVVKKNASTFIRMATQNLFDAPTHDRIKDQIDQFTEEALRTPLQGVIASLQGMKIRMDREALLHFGPYPKLMIAGEKDTIMPLEELKEETDGTEVQLEVIPCGHVAPLETPELVIEKLKSFLKAL